MTDLYVVTLCVNFDGYEKLIDHFIEADSVQDAEYQALLNETHNEAPMSFNQYLKGDKWWEDDNMIYEVFRVRKVSEHLKDAFKSFFI